jgi:hypothetical protein
VVSAGNFKVGDTLVAVGRWQAKNTPVTVTITKVGRKWLTVGYSGMRVDTGTLTPEFADMDVFPNMETFVARRALEAEWTAFRNCVKNGYMPDDLTVEAIQQARVTLGLAPKKI